MNAEDELRIEKYFENRFDEFAEYRRMTFNPVYEFWGEEE